MRLFILEPVNSWEPWYDRAFGFVVRADNEAAARIAAGDQAGNEGREAWLSNQLTTCEELTSDGTPGVVLRDFWSA